MAALFWQALDPDLIIARLPWATGVAAHMVSAAIQISAVITTERSIHDA